MTEGCDDPRRTWVRELQQAAGLQWEDWHRQVGPCCLDLAESIAGGGVAGGGGGAGGAEARHSGLRICK